MTRLVLKLSRLDEARARLSNSRSRSQPSGESSHAPTANFEDLRVSPDSTISYPYIVYRLTPQQIDEDLLAIRKRLALNCIFQSRILKHVGDEVTPRIYLHRITIDDFEDVPFVEGIVATIARFVRVFHRTLEFTEFFSFEVMRRAHPALHERLNAVGMSNDNCDVQFQGERVLLRMKSSDEG